MKAKKALRKKKVSNPLKPGYMEFSFESNLEATFFVWIMDREANPIIPRQAVECVPVDGLITINIITLESRSNMEVYFRPGKHTIFIQQAEPEKKSKKLFSGRKLKAEFSLTEDQATLWANNILEKRMSRYTKDISRVFRQIGDKKKLALLLEDSKPPIKEEEIFGVDRPIILDLSQEDRMSTTFEEKVDILHGHPLTNGFPTNGASVLEMEKVSVKEKPELKWYQKLFNKLGQT